MRISKDYLFILLYLFFFITDCLIITGLNTNPFAFIFIAFNFIVMPGFIISNLIDQKSINPIDRLIYSVGISLILIILTTLVTNFAMPIIGITRPISLMPLLVVYNFSLLIISLVVYFRMKNQLILNIKYNFKYSHFMYLIPVLFPILSILGAISLNNNGTNYFTLSAYVGIILYVIVLVILKNKLNKNIYPWSLYFISLALVLSGSLRSWYIASTDATLEYGIGNFILNLGNWDYWIGRNNYFGMLSIVMLPTTLSLYLDTNLLVIQKILLPFIFSLLPLIIYRLFLKITNYEFAFLSCLFFIFQPTFAIWNLFPPRQEIAFFMLGILYLTLFNEKFKYLTKTLLFTLFSFGVITSHYSTTYITSLLLVLSYLIYLCIVFIKNKKEKDKKIIINKNVNLNVQGTLVIIFLAIEVIWYFGMTDIGIKAVNLADSKLGANAFSFDKSPLKIFNAKATYNPSEDLEDYISKMGDLRLTSLPESTLDLYPIFLMNTSELPHIKNYPLLYSLSEKTKIILLALGGILLLWGLITYTRKVGIYKLNYIIYSIVSVLILAIFAQLPFVNSFYDPIRLYQQLLLILAVFCIIGLGSLFRRNNITIGIFTVFLILYFIFLNHIQYYFIGGNRVQLTLANVGKDYDFSYTTKDEVYSMNWLLMNKPEKNTIALDNYAQFKLYQSTKYNLSGNVKLDVLPNSINKNDYVYSTRTNIDRGITFKYGNNGLLIYNYPLHFLNDNKDLIYSNKSSIIYK